MRTRTAIVAVLVACLFGCVLHKSHGIAIRGAPVADADIESSGPSGPSEPEFVPVQQLEKDVDAEDQKANDAAKKVRIQKEQLKQAKTDLAAALKEAEKMSEDTHGKVETDALKPSFAKMMDQTGNETSQAKMLLKKVQMLQANMTLEQLDAMNLAKDDAAFREKEVERCQLNILHLERKLANATRAVKLQKELTAISTQSMQASLHRAYQANKNAVNAPHIEVETIEQQLSRAQSATKRAHVFYAQLQVRAQLMRGAEKMRKHFAEAVANAKVECGSFQKNLKAKEVNMEKPDDTVEIPGPVALTKDPKKIPEWFTKFLRKSGWKAPDAGEVESSEKDVSASLKTADSSKEIQAGEVTVHPPTAPGGNHKVVVKLPSQNGKTRIAHNAEVHLDLAVQKAKKADMGAGKKAETSSSTGAFDAEMKREKVEDGDDDDGMETGAPGSASGATGNSELDNSKTGAATGSSENENKVTASAEKEAKSAAVSKVENELKRANEELLSLETNLKIPVDGTTARAANAAAKVADDKTMRRASSNIDQLEKKLGMLE